MSMCNCFTCDCKCSKCVLLLLWHVYVCVACVCICYMFICVCVCQSHVAKGFIRPFETMYAFFFLCTNVLECVYALYMWVDMCVYPHGHGSTRNGTSCLMVSEGPLFHWWSCTKKWLYYKILFCLLFVSSCLQFSLLFCLSFRIGPIV